jgi:hypothetical protein
MILYHKLRSTIILLLVLTSAVASAQFVPQRVVAFKNGLSFLHERGTFPTVQGEAVLNLSFPNYSVNESGKPEELFRVSTGSERVGSQEAEISRYWTSTSLRTQITRDTAMGLDQLLFHRGNRGKDLMVTLKDGSELSGKLAEYSSSVLTLELSSTEFGQITLSEIRGIRFTNAPSRYGMKSDTTSEKVFNVELASPVGKKVELDLFYLARGFNWTPVYNVVLKPDNRLSLTLDAQIVNGQKDYENVNLQLGIGQPKFEYASGKSFFFNKKLMAVFSQPARNFEHVNYNQMLSNTFSQSGRPAQSTTRKATMDAGGLFFYQIPDFSLGRQQTANYRLLTLEATYTDEYVVGLNTEGNLNTEGEGLLPVAHHIRFTNGGELPLTTGMAFITDAEQRATGQSKMDFTPSESTTSLPLSGATEVVVTQVGETKRIDSLRRGSSYGYQTTFVVNVENFKDKAVDLRLTRNVNGEVAKSSVKPSVIGSKYTQNLNPVTNTYRWDLTVPAGGKETLTFTFEFWGR